MKYSPEGVATGMVAVVFLVWKTEPGAWSKADVWPTSDLSSSGLHWSFWASNLVFHLSNGRNDFLCIISDELGRR